MNTPCAERLTLTTVATLPGGNVLVATHYLKPDEDLDKAIRSRMDLPGVECVSVSRHSKDEILEHLGEMTDLLEVGPDIENVN